MSEERDRTTAAAIQVAYENLIRLGWKFSAEDIGKSARAIVDAFDGIKNDQSGSGNK